VTFKTVHFETQLAGIGEFAFHTPPSKMRKAERDSQTQTRSEKQK
jgi:hypothetical protein